MTKAGARRATAARRGPADSPEGTQVRHVSDAERRARLVARHHLARTARDVVDVVRSVAALHSSDPLTPYLAAWARVPGFETAHLTRALVDDRSLWRMHGMRRTLFVVAADEGAIVEAAAARDVAQKERARLERCVAAEIRGSASKWLAKLEARVMDALADGEDRRTQDLSAAIPELATPVTLGSGKWATRAAIGSRALLLMAMDGRIVRTRSASWRSGQYRWAEVARWFGRAPAPSEPAAARATLARRYLETHGPVTMTDLRWWTGWTKKHASAALSAIDARAVSLDGGAEGFLLPHDVEPLVQGTSHVALLPALDPTPMGWKERAWYLGAHAKALYDTNGNAGPTVWIDGRVVGGWAQRPDGEVVHRLLEDVGARAHGRIEREAASLEAWLRGVVTVPRFRTPLERELSSP